MTTTITVKSFDPLVLELPTVDPIPAGPVRIQLPEHKLNFGTLDLLDWKVGADLPLFGLTMELPEPVDRSKMAAKVTELAPLLEELHAEIQAKLDERGALYGKGKLPGALQLAALASYIERGGR